MPLDDDDDDDDDDADIGGVDVCGGVVGRGVPVADCMEAFWISSTDMFERRRRSSELKKSSRTGGPARSCCCPTDGRIIPRGAPPVSCWDGR